MAASENKRDKRFFTGSTWWLVATGGVFWYARHQDRIAEPDGFDDLGKHCWTNRSLPTFRFPDLALL